MLSIGSWITLGDPAITEIMTKAGFEWLAIDLEHSTIDISRAQDLIRIIQLSDCAALVRVSENDPTIIKRVMDAGAQGVIVPMVNSRQDCLRAVEAVKYPPEGKRGVGLGRAQMYGLEFEKYKKWVNKESIVIVQIEHIQAVRNLGEILRVPGVDGFIVGPYDLSASLGKPGEFNHPEVIKALKTIKAVAGETGITRGFHVIHPDALEVRKKIKDGYKFIAFSLDGLFLGAKCSQEMLKLRMR